MAYPFIRGEFGTSWPLIFVSQQIESGHVSTKPSPIFKLSSCCICVIFFDELFPESWDGLKKALLNFQLALPATLDQSSS